MPPEGHLRGAGTLTSCDAAAGLTASLGSAFSNLNDPNQTADSPTQGTTPAERTLSAARRRKRAATALASHWRGYIARWAPVARYGFYLARYDVRCEQRAERRTWAARAIALRWRHYELHYWAATATDIAGLEGEHGQTRMNTLC